MPSMDRKTPRSRQDFDVFWSCNFEEENCSKRFNERSVRVDSRCLGEEACAHLIVNFATYIKDNEQSHAHEQQQAAATGGRQHTVDISAQKRAALGIRTPRMRVERQHVMW